MDQKNSGPNRVVDDKIFLFIIAGLCALLFYTPFKFMVNKWITEFDSSYSPGPFAPIVSGYIIWKKKDLLKTLPPKPTLWGLAIIVPFLLLHIIGQIGDLQQISIFCFVCILAGLSIFLRGWDFTYEILFALGFLFFMIPMGFLDTMVGIPLRMIASNWAAVILNLMGFDIIRVGTQLQFAGMFALDVAAPCSGLKSLVSLIALGLAFAYLSEKSNWKRLIIIISSVPIAIFANIVRIVLIGLIAISFGEKAALGFFHSFSGFFLFGFALFALAGIGRILSWKKEDFINI